MHIVLLYVDLQATAGSGGWPMSVWLTPDLKPIVGGTYFPPDDRYYGRPGFKSILTMISKKVLLFDSIWLGVWRLAHCEICARKAAN